MKKPLYIFLCLLLLPAAMMQAQVLEGEDGSNRFQWGRDSTHTNSVKVPIGVTQFTLNPLLGEVVQKEEVDTVMQGFQHWATHDGDEGSYSHTGAYGSPRLSRLFFQRRPVFDTWFFLDAYDYFLPNISTFRFSNTKSPITNLSYHRAGSSSQGNDRVRAYFASNINKQAGIGFLLDYLYARGQYNFQQNSMFTGALYGYYHGDHYQMNAWINSNNLKMAENGGITDDNYITHPEIFERSFNTRDIPTQLSDTWNRNNAQTYYLTHRFNMGYYRRAAAPDTTAQDTLKRALAMSTAPAQTLPADSAATDSALTPEFVPVASIIHTFQARTLDHRYSGHRSNVNAHYYTHDWGMGENTNDESTAMSFTNTVALSLREGFRPWVKAGLTAFATHEFIKYTLPDSASWRENNISVGGVFARTSGRALHFNATGQVTLIGELAGDFNIDGTIETRFKLFKDTCMLAAHAYLRNDKPNFFFRHYHSRYARWDNNLDKEMRTRIEGTLSLKRLGTSLDVGVENITNYTYLRTKLTPNEGDGSNPFSHNVVPVQEGGSVQVFAATLRQNFKFGMLHWNNALTYQKSSSEDVLPLPDFNYWTDLYIQFRIAGVLNLQLGADMRYFTRYRVPYYSPVMNAFSTQDAEYATTLGGYPIIDAYVNAHLKHFRAYLNVQHVNSTFMTGEQFLAPHYPIDPMTIRFGISWNFFN